MKKTIIILAIITSAGVGLLKVVSTLENTQKVMGVIGDKNIKLQRSNDSLASGMETLQMKMDSLAATVEGIGIVSLTQLIDKLNGSVYKVSACYPAQGQTEKPAGSATDEDSLVWKTGTAFCVFRGDIMITNHHVFNDNALHAVIEDINGGKFKVTDIITASKELDYTLFKAENISGLPIIIAEEELKVGQNVMTIGNPLNLDFTPSEGMITGYRQDNVVIQTDVPVTHGSSGGPLINRNGEVIGIIFGGMDNSAQLNFAVNIHAIIADIYETVKNNSAKSKEENSFNQQNPEGDAKIPDTKTESILPATFENNVHKIKKSR